MTPQERLDYLGRERDSLIREWLVLDLRTIKDQQKSLKIQNELKKVVAEINKLENL